MTGASGGIGSEIAESFAAAGYAVALGYNKNSEAAEKLRESIVKAGGSCIAVKGDTSSEAQVDEMFAQTEKLLGQVEVLVNCAGLSHFGLLTDMSLCQWDEIMQVNLTSVFLCCRRALPSMISEKDGCIINISSVWGESGASCEAAYSAAKAGVIGLTKALAREEGPCNIRVNCITPGLIDTKMNKRLSREEENDIIDEIPLGRSGLPEEVAHAALFLAENKYTTGAVLRVDGGMI